MKPVTSDRWCRWLAAALAIAATGFCGAAGAQEPAAIGTPIVELIRRLEQQGIAVIYSNELVTESMQVLSAPGTAGGVDGLREALEPYDLTVERGPRGSWLVVRSPDAQSAGESAPEAPAPGTAEARPPAIENIVVSASRYAFSRATGTSTTRLEHTQLTDAPTLGQDALRAPQALPGVTSSHLTARMNVRGGDSDEVLIVLDGLRLYNPFHLKDFQSLFSSLNPAIIDSMAVYSGAYPAQFGDRMSAVVDVRTLVPEDDRLHEVGFTTLTSSVLSSGRFADGRGSWLTSARRGNLDLLIEAARSQLGKPRYFDVYNNLRYQIGPRLNVSGGFLVLNDEIALNDPDIATARAEYRDGYLWTRADYTADRLDVGLLIARADLSTKRNGMVDDPVRSTGQLIDRRDFENDSLQLTWGYRINERNWLRGGVEIRSSDASYDFSSSRVDHVAIVTPGLLHSPADVDERARISTTQRAFFLSYRTRLLEPVTAEIGIRRDQQDFPADRQASPRASVLFDLTPRASLRASWGRFYQAHGADELQVSDGVTHLFPAQESEQTVVGFEYFPGESTTLRIEAYRKEFERVRPRFENLFARVSLLPELTPDRVMIAPVRGKAMGIEISVDAEQGPWLWSVSLAHARTRDVLAVGEIYRSWEEPWSLKGNLHWTGNRWIVSAAAAWHTGWPISDLALVDGQLVAGHVNGSRFPSFATVDVRASRTVSLAHGELEWFAELNNALNRENPCCIDYDVGLGDQGQPVSMSAHRNDWFGAVPTIGFLWRRGRSER
jgi:outer membrane cobalamin receptor